MNSQKSANKNFTSIVFDIDGTLVSTNKLIFASFNHVTKKYLGKEYSENEIVKLFGPTEDVILKQWMKDNYPSARKDYYGFYSENHEQMTHTIDGLKDLLEEIRMNNINLAVFTGKGRESTNITLDKLGLADYFNIVISGDDVKNHKPAADGLNNIINEFNENPENVLMVGDAPSDITASRAAGCKCAAVLWDGHPIYKPEELSADYIVNNVEELRDLILK